MSYRFDIFKLVHGGRRMYIIYRVTYIDEHGVIIISLHG